VISITIGEVLRTIFHASPILSFSLCCANTVGSAIPTRQKAKHSNEKKIRENFLLALQIRPASLIGAKTFPLHL
jgi:hypothetical protein